MTTNYGLTSFTSPTYGGVSWEQNLINQQAKLDALMQSITSASTPATTSGNYNTNSFNMSNSPASSYDMTDLMAELRKMPTTVTTTAQQNPSSQLEDMYAQMQGNVAELQQRMGQAYQAKENTYSGLLTALADMFRTTGSRGSGAVQTSALASGLTPMEASQQGQNTLLQALQAYAPERANLEAQQSDVGVQLQSALANVMQGIQLPLTNMMSPYYQGVAGTTQTTDDPTQKMNLLFNLASSIQSQQLAQQQLTQSGQQFDQSMDFNQQQLAQNMQQFLLGQQQAGSQFGQTMGLNQQQLAQSGQQFDQTLGLNQAQLAQGNQQFGQSMGFNQAQLAQSGQQAQLLEAGRTQRAQEAIQGRADLQQAAFDYQTRLRNEEQASITTEFNSGIQEYQSAFGLRQLSGTALPQEDLRLLYQDLGL